MRFSLNLIEKFNRFHFRKLINVIKDIKSQKQSDEKIIENINTLPPFLLTKPISKILINETNIIFSFSEKVMTTLLEEILSNGSAVLLQAYFDILKKSIPQNKNIQPLDINKALDAFFNKELSDNIDLIKMMDLLLENLVNLNWHENTRTHQSIIPLDNIHTSLLHKALESSIIYCNLDCNALSVPYFNVLKHLIQKGVKQEDNAGEIVFIAINSGVKELLAEVLNIENVDRTYINKSLTRIKQIDELMLRQNLLNITPHSQQEKIQEMIEILNIKFEQEEFEKVFTKDLKNESKKTRIKI